MTEEVKQEVEKVQVHIDEVKKAVTMADQLAALNKVPEFEELIIKGFMTNEPARIAAIITDPNLQDEVNQRELFGAIKAVGYLQDYLRNIERRGVQLRAALAEAENYKTELLNSKGD